MKKKEIALLVALSLFPAVAEAELYDDVTARIVSSNLELQRLKQENIAEHAGMKMENMLPDTEVDFDNVWASGDDEYRWNLTVSQSFDFPGAYKARNKELRARSRAMELGLMSAKTDCVLKAYELLVEISYCNRVIELENGIVKDMNRLSALLQKSFEHGETTILDVNRSRIEQANSVIKLREHKAQRAKCVAELKTLGYELEAVENVSYPMLEFQSLDAYLAAIDNDPLIAYYSELKKAELLGVKSRKMENIPGFKLGYVHEYEERTHFNGFTVGISLPFFKGKSRVALAVAQAEAADWQERLARIEYESTITGEYEMAIANKELYEMLAPVFYNNNNIALLSKAFEGGQMSAIDYLREIEYFRESEVDFLSIEYDYQLSLVRLNKFQLLLKH